MPCFNPVLSDKHDIGKSSLKKTKATTRKENLRLLLFLAMLPHFYLLSTSKVGAENTRWENEDCLDDLVCISRSHPCLWLQEGSVDPVKPDVHWAQAVQPPGDHDPDSAQQQHLHSNAMCACLWESGAGERKQCVVFVFTVCTESKGFSIQGALCPEDQFFLCKDLRCCS